MYVGVGLRADSFNFIYFVQNRDIFLPAGRSGWEEGGIGRRDGDSARRGEDKRNDQDRISFSARLRV